MDEAKGLLNREAVASALKKIREAFDEFSYSLRTFVETLFTLETDKDSNDFVDAAEIILGLCDEMDSGVHNAFDKQVEKLGIEFKPDAPKPKRKKRGLSIIK